MSGEITLRKIDETNFVSAFNLKLGEGQEEYVSHPIRSLAQAYVYRDQSQPFGIYCDEEMVGYVMVIYDYDIPEYDIWHLMIDASHQKRGYGKAAMRKCLEYIASQPYGDSKRICLTCNENNQSAIHMYETLGFRKTGVQDEDEIEMVLNID